MRAIPATEFKAKCLELMDRVAERRETFVITKRGRPVAKLVPVEAKSEETLFGCLQGQATINGDIVTMVSSDIYETVRGWDELTASSRDDR